MDRNNLNFAYASGAVAAFPPAVECGLFRWRQVERRAQEHNSIGESQLSGKDPQLVKLYFKTVLPPTYISHGPHG
jgi:hypothetical protein